MTPETRLQAQMIDKIEAHKKERDDALAAFANQQQGIEAMVKEINDLEMQVHRWKGDYDESDEELGRCQAQCQAQEKEIGNLRVENLKLSNTLAALAAIIQGAR